MRLDRYLFENGFVKSRTKASELIKNKRVEIDGTIITKPSYMVEDEPKIKILEKKLYVSRAAYKLKNFLLDNGINIDGSKCLDIGSSTGGFVEVLLEYGAKSVSAVDVGKDQLDLKLKEDIRVKSYENTDIRDFDDVKFDVVTCDVSFISVRYILDDIDRLSNDKIILLFKPQFEVGKSAKRDKKGVLMDEKALKEAYKRFEESIKRFKWKFEKKENSKLKGKEGNVETFYYFRKR